MPMSRTAIIVLILLSTCTGGALAQPSDTDAAPPPGADAGRSASSPRCCNDRAAPSPNANLGDSICLMIEAAARSNDLPLEFFARVIWQESRFQPGVVGRAPAAATGRRASPSSCRAPRQNRGLLDPFDPVQALPKSAEFLRELRGQFGNLGLAAAAYNAGPQRVRAWMAGSRTLPAETPQLCAGDHRDSGRRLGEGRTARARATHGAELHAADRVAAPRA